MQILHMGAPDEILQRELRRSRRQRWATLPLTLPLIPDVLRVAALRALAGVARSVGEVIAARSRTGDEEAPPNVSTIIISESQRPSVNLVAVCRAPQSRRLLSR